MHFKISEDLAKNDKDTSIFDKDPYSDPPHLRRNYLNPQRGVHFYFRNAKLQMQERFAELIDHEPMPRVFLHGSPHVDNYSKSEQGAAMVDFDRSRIGPYAWDLVRVATSVSFRQRRPARDLLEPKVAAVFKRGYLRGFRNPQRSYAQMRKLRSIRPRPEENSTTAYLRANRKWAEELRVNVLPNDDPFVQQLTTAYVASREELAFFQDWMVTAAGRGSGSMGRERLLVVLAPKKKEKRDPVLLEIKRVRMDPDNHWYSNPFGHHGERMIAAAELYAPGWERHQGFATLDGLEYWGHQIPNQNVKLKKMLTNSEQRMFLFAVGTQLGRAHRLSLNGVEPEQLIEHLKKNYDEILNAGLIMKQEIRRAYKRYMKHLQLA